MRLSKRLSNSAIWLAVFLLPTAANAAEGPSPMGKLQQFGPSAGYSTGTDVYSIISAVIKGALSLLGAIFLVYMVYAGYTWTTAGGNEEKVKHSQTVIRNCVIGLLITLCAYAISAFVIKQLTAATLSPSSGGAPGTP